MESKTNFSLKELMNYFRNHGCSVSQKMRAGYNYVEIKRTYNRTVHTSSFPEQPNYTLDYINKEAITLNICTSINGDKLC